MVVDLVYHDQDGTLSAATYGRSIWADKTQVIQFLSTMAFLKPVCSRWRLSEGSPVRLWFHRPEFTFVTVRIVCGS